MRMHHVAWCRGHPRAGNLVRLVCGSSLGRQTATSSFAAVAPGLVEIGSRSCRLLSEGVVREKTGAATAVRPGGQAGRAVVARRRPGGTYSASMRVPMR